MKVEPQQAAALLEQNFENMCKKLAAGATLTHAEAAMLEKHAARAPQPVAAPAPAPDPVETHDLLLAPVAAPVPDDGEATAEQIARWSELYGTKRRALYRWIAAGRDAHDPCPLDSPARMPLWWASHMKHRVPDKILAAARAAGATVSVSVSDHSTLNTQHSTSSSPTATLPLHLPDLALENLDFATQVEQMRQELARIQRQLDDARRGKTVDGSLFVDQPAVESLLRQRLAIQEPLRKAEGDLTAWLAQRELLVPTADVRAENNRIATAICSAVLRLVKNTRPQLAGKSDPEQDRIWTDATLACFSVLKTARFTSLNPEDLAA